ncbi:MAG: hypothetical protein LBT40_06270 [Deltaproteobacteria bacterium]|nr:hypothetical protein [Deltaproteobacteria bacterium]
MPLHVPTCPRQAPAPETPSSRGRPVAALRNSPVRTSRPRNQRSWTLALRASGHGPVPPGGVTRRQADREEGRQAPAPASPVVAGPGRAPAPASPADAGPGRAPALASPADAGPDRAPASS